MKPPFKENGMRYGQDANGERVCLGAQMGRASYVPADYQGQRLSLRRVPMVSDGAYDQGGAYWGSGEPLFCAWGETKTEQVQIFVRARDREEAKSKMRVQNLTSLQFHR